MGLWMMNLWKLLNFFTQLRIYSQRKKGNSLTEGIVEFGHKADVEILKLLAQKNLIFLIYSVNGFNVGLMAHMGLIFSLSTFVNLLIT